MKKVKDYLFELDEEELAEYFYHNYYFKASEYEKKAQNMTLNEIRKASDKYLHKLLNHLKKLTPKKIPHRKKGVFFAKEYNGDAVMALTYINELIEKKIEAETYGYDIIRQEEILSYYIAETKYTKDHIHEAFADLLWEVSFFGIKQEKLDKFLKNLDKSIKETDEEYKKYEVVDKTKAKKLSDVYSGYKLVGQNDFMYYINDSIRRYKKERELEEVMMLLRKDNL